jgi:hypothetical protein
MVVEKVDHQLVYQDRRVLGENQPWVKRPDEIRVQRSSLFAIDLNGDVKKVFLKISGSEKKNVKIIKKGTLYLPKATEKDRGNESNGRSKGSSYLEQSKHNLSSNGWPYNRST